ncbi:MULTISPECIES: QueT transporter family protein [unclassified Gemella]|uniref:QueT transporter family protein n=1 Tax=unclassified Gemella TaxID=2624949 RepID=UPI001C046B82|nr:MULTISPECIES: QueT transporter family protein [unclassified Gemella]MBU0279010.1 QueT transporter family protein [Gemella sp. zg-1178]QWQ39082.1 QueT transporter family protein [Gemella sp. zg-570]
MRNNKVKILTLQALIAAIYVVLTVSNLSFSYGAIQFRYSESLAQLVVFSPLFWVPITLGVAIANFFSPLGLVDVFFGTLGTGLALALSIFIFKFIKNRIVRHIVNIVVYLGVCMPIIAYEIAIFSGENSARVAFEWDVFVAIYASLLLSQFLVMGFGIFITEILNKAVNLEKIFK